MLPHEKTDPRLGWKLREANSPHPLSRTEIAILLREAQFVGEPLAGGAGMSRGEAARRSTRGVKVDTNFSLLLDIEN